MSAIDDARRTVAAWDATTKSISAPYVSPRHLLDAIEGLIADIERIQGPITDAQVRPIARAIYAGAYAARDLEPEWDGESAGVQEFYMREGRAALEAAREVSS